MEFTKKSLIDAFPTIESLADYFSEAIDTSIIGISEEYFDDSTVKIVLCLIIPESQNYPAYELIYSEGELLGIGQSFKGAFKPTGHSPLHSIPFLQNFIGYSFSLNIESIIQYLQSSGWVVNNSNSTRFMRVTKGQFSQSSKVEILHLDIDECGRLLDYRFSHWVNKNNDNHLPYNTEPFFTQKRSKDLVYYPATPKAEIFIKNNLSRFLELLTIPCFPELYQAVFGLSPQYSYNLQGTMVDIADRQGSFIGRVELA